MSLRILGLGTAVPQYAVNQNESTILSEWVNADSPERAALIQRIQRRSQVKRRRSVLLINERGETIQERLPFYGVKDPSTNERMQKYRIHASSLAINACQLALEETSIAPNSITHLITVCCTGFHAPGVDFDLIETLELNPSVQRTQIGFMGCHAAMNALRVAHAFVEADPDAIVLVCAVELCSLHLQYGWEPEQVVANTLFADGAAALVASGTTKKWMNKTKKSLTLWGSGSTVIPNTRDLMHWQIGDHGFSMGLSPKVPDAIAKTLKPWLSDWLLKYGLDQNIIQNWAIHPGGPRILQACAEALELQEDQLATSRFILSEYGNMSSATVLFVLHHMQQQECIGPTLALAFGPGLCAEVALLDISSN